MTYIYIGHILLPCNKLSQYRITRGWVCGSAGKYLSSMHTQPIAGSSALNKSGVVVQACNPSAREAEARGSEIPGHLLLHSEFKASGNIQW